MIRRPPRSTPLYSSAASDVYKRQDYFHPSQQKMRVLDRLPLRGLVHNLPARPKATLAVVAILGLAASAYVYATTASNLQEEQEELFRDHASARIQSVKYSLQSNVTLASSLNALLHSSQEVTYSEFRTFATETQAGLEHPHLAACV